MDHRWRLPCAATHIAAAYVRQISFPNARVILQKQQMLKFGLGGHYNTTESSSLFTSWTPREVKSMHKALVVFDYVLSTCF